MSYNIKNGRLLNNEGIKNIDNDKKIRKTSIDIYPNYKKSESNPIKSDSDIKNIKNDVEKIKKNLILDFVDFPETNISEEKLENIFDLDEYLSLSAKPLISNYKPYIHNKSQNNTDENTDYKIDQITNQKSNSLKKKDNNIMESNINEKKTKKKKTSLLRRTTSVPKLIGNFEEEKKEEFQEIKSFINKNSKINRNDLSDSEVLIKSNNNYNVILDQNDNDKCHQFHISHTEGENKLKNKKELDVDLEEDNEIISELNSPHNELFFYLFENLLEDYMKSKYSNFQIKKEINIINKLIEN